MPTFDTPTPISATVELPIGELHVVASDRADTTVDVRSTPGDRAEADGVRVELVGQELRVTGRPLGILRQLTPKTPGRSIEVVIALPTGSGLSARSGYGGITAGGRLGSCAIRTKYGDVRIEDAASATLALAYGRARATGTIDGDADLVSDHGGVHVRDVGGSATLRSKHGTIRADRIGGKALLTGGHGAIDVDAVEADAHVRTTYGNVRLGRIARGEVTVASSHGRMEIGIAETSAAWLDVDTRGRISNDLTPRDDSTGFAETVTVHARSQDGNIVIRRA